MAKAASNPKNLGREGAPRMLAPSLDPPLPRKVGISDNYFFPMISFVKFILVTHTFGGEYYNTITTYELCKRIQISRFNKMLFLWVLSASDCDSDNWLRFRFGHQRPLNHWCPSFVGHWQFNYGGGCPTQPGNAVKSRLHVIVFILVIKTRHRWFTCCQCPNLNLRQLSESQSEALRIHLFLKIEKSLQNEWQGRIQDSP